MQRIEAIAAAPDHAIPDPVPLIDAPLIGAAIPDMNDQAIGAAIPYAAIDAAIVDLVAIQDAAAHVVIVFDGPASAQCSC